MGEPARLRPGRRLLGVGLAVVLLGGGGVLLDRVVKPHQAVGRPVPAHPSGAWFCPHGGRPGARGWVAVANPGPGPVRIRVTQFGADGVRSVESSTLGPGRQQLRPVAAAGPAEATEVEYFGGWVGAAAVLRSPSGLAAEACQPSPRRSWYVLDTPTGAGQTGYVVVMNPFADPAEFDVVIRTERRRLAPGPLTPYVLGPRRVVAIRLNRYALAGPGEHSVTAQVVQRVGRVVAGGMELSRGGLRIEAAGPGKATRWVTPLAGDSRARAVVLLDPGRRPADLSVAVTGPGGGRAATGPEGLRLPAQGVRTLPLPAVPGFALEVASTNGEGVAAAARLTGPTGRGGRGADGATAGAARPASRWLVLPAIPPSGGSSSLVVANPGPEAAAVAFRILGGAALPSPITLAPGRATRVVLPGPAPVSVLVSSTGAPVVVGVAATGSGGGFAATLGVAVPEWA